MSTGLLELGFHLALHVREERLSTRHDACRLMYVSDIHLRCGRADRLCRQVLESVQQCETDVVLLGGDLVDGLSELSKLSDLVGRLCLLLFESSVRIDQAGCEPGRQRSRADSLAMSSGSCIVLRLTFTERKLSRR